MSATTSRGVLEVYSSQKSQFATTGAVVNVKRCTPNNAEGKAKGDDVLPLYLAPYFKPHSPKC